MLSVFIVHMNVDRNLTSSKWVQKSKTDAYPFVRERDFLNTLLQLISRLLLDLHQLLKYVYVFN